MSPKGTRREAGRGESPAQAFSRSENLGEGEFISPEQKSNIGNPNAARRSGRVWEVEDLAFQNAPMPAGLDLAEQMLFQAFRRLYQYAKLVQMEPERGRIEKLAILREYEKRAAQVKHLEKTAAMWKAIEAAANRYGTQRTLENADAFVEAVYGVKMKGAENGNQEK